MQKYFYLDTGFAQYGAQGSLGHIAGVVRQRDFLAALGMPPDFMAAWSGSVIRESKRTQSAAYFEVLETRESTQLMEFPRV